MTWEPVAGIAAGIVLLGAALPAAWRFWRALSKVPKIVDGIAAEFASDGNGSMRTAIDQLDITTTDLSDDLKRLRATQHDLVNKITVAVGTATTTAKVVEVQAAEIHAHAEAIATHTREDSSQFVAVRDVQDVILSRLDSIDSQLAEAKSLAEVVRHDLSQFNEIDQLGREGKVDRRDASPDP